MYSYKIYLLKYHTAYSLYNVLLRLQLQFQNLDVNLAVNNLLSRDDEGDDDGGDCDTYMSGRLQMRF